MVNELVLLRTFCRFTDVFKYMSEFQFTYVSAVFVKITAGRKTDFIVNCGCRVVLCLVMLFYSKMWV